MPKKHKISNFLSIGILIILVVNIYSTFLIFQEITKFTKNDAEIINTSGKIRGAIQRYVKLKLLHSKLSLTKDSVNKNLKELNFLIKETFQNKKIIESIEKELEKIETLWNKILLTNNKEKLLLSEKAWQHSNHLTNKLQKLSEEKSKTLWH